VPPAADGQQDAVVAGIVDRSDDIGPVDAARDQRGFLVDHGIVEFARLVVASVMWFKYFPTQAGTKSGVVSRHVFTLLNGYPGNGYSLRGVPDFDEYTPLLPGD
jgi:hypothetical protein